MVIVESTLSHKIFHDQTDPQSLADLGRITLGLGKAASVVLFTYFFLRLLALADGGHWDLLNTAIGSWYLLELFGFVLLPCFVLAFAVRARNVKLVRAAAVLTVIGIIISRLNISLVAMNWNVPDRYFPSAMEIITTVTIITLGILTFRFIVKRMPVLYEHPEYGSAH